MSNNPRLVAAIDAARTLASPGEVLDLIEALAEDAEVAAMECSHAWQETAAGAPWRLIASRIGKACDTVRRHADFADWK